MRRLIVVCEGETEQEFCRTVLEPYFAFSIDAPKIKKSKGGIVAWENLVKQIGGHLREGVYVSTLIDFYGIKPEHNFPNWEKAQQIKDKHKQLELIEAGMKKSIEERHLDNRHLFIPYLQLHEFEALLFSNKEELFRNISRTAAQALEQVFEEFSNPELINEHPDTTPSQRLKNNIDGYNKVVYGSILADAIGIEAMKAHCPHFAEWIKKLKKLQ
jgi:hypothetical protein